MKRNNDINGKPGCKPQGPNPKDAIKTRPPVEEMRVPIFDFCAQQKELFISLNNDTQFPWLEVADVRLVEGQFILILTPASIFLNKLEDGSQFAGFIIDKEGHGLKMTKRVYGNFTCNALSTDADLLKPLAEVDPMVKKMLSHGAKFFTLSFEELLVYFGGGQVYRLDSAFTPSFAPYEPNGRKRYEHSRHVLMEYQGREVIFSSLVEGNTYYTLAKADSNKMTHIKGGGVCKFYDGRDNHFESTVTILPQERVLEIYHRLVETNNAFFKSPENLVALSYHK